MSATVPRWLALTALLTASCAPAPDAGRDPNAPPNVVFILTDDQGWADVGYHEVDADIRTPNIDAIAAWGASFTNAYATAPQCVPSRAALMTGRYQQRIGVDENAYTPLPLSATTVGERFSSLGYSTGYVGKWHLDVDENSDRWFEANHAADYPGLTSPGQLPLSERLPYFPDQRGFDRVYFGFRNSYRINFDQGGSLDARRVTNTDYRIDVASDAAVAFIEQNRDEPFYLHVSYYGPHWPIEASGEYLDRVEFSVGVRRRYALATMLAIDDGVGRIVAELERHGLLEDTLLIFMSDHGTPLGLTATDSPLDDTDNEWIGSLNDPFPGEKGMLAEGGIRVPLAMRWPGNIPAGAVLDHPVNGLDVVATALTAAGLDASALATMDGLDLRPVLTGGDSSYLAERPLFWRFWGQSAVRMGDWKYLRAGDREFLFDLSVQGEVGPNLIDDNPAMAAALRARLDGWAAELATPGVPVAWRNAKEQSFYDYFFTPAP